MESPNIPSLSNVCLFKTSGFVGVCFVVCFFLKSSIGIF